MVNAQEWLDQNYPKEERSEVEEIHLNEPNLEGELDLSEFTYEYGLKVYTSSQVDETKPTFINEPKNAKIIKLVNAQEWLESQEKYNTKEKRKRIKELNIKCNQLEGKLNLNDFISLEKLDCSNNRILTGNY